MSDSVRGAAGELDLQSGAWHPYVLLEWTFPGCLRSAGEVTDHGSRLIDEAADRAATARRRGLGPPLVA